MKPELLKQIVEAALLAAEQPLNLNQLSALFDEGEAPGHADLSQALEALAADCQDRGVELSEVASGYRLQVKPDLQPWISRLWAEKPPRYSRALLETLAIIAYRQPMTRAEIEQIRGVAVSSNIMRTLQEREWVRIVGHRDVPGRPALVGTTKRFLDYFNLSSLDQLPSLAELRDLGELEPELELEVAHALAVSRSHQQSAEPAEPQYDEIDDASSEPPANPDTDTADPDGAAEFDGSAEQGQLDQDLDVEDSDRQYLGDEDLSEEDLDDQPSAQDDLSEQDLYDENLDDQDSDQDDPGDEALAKEDLDDDAGQRHQDPDPDHGSEPEHANTGEPDSSSENAADAGADQPTTDSDDNDDDQTRST